MGAASRSASARSAFCALAVALVVSTACGSERAASTPSPTLPATPRVSPTATTVVTPSAAPTATPFAERIDHGAVMDHVRALSVEIGLRNAGSNGDERASTYIAGRIERLGWTVERRPFPLPQGGESTNVVGTPPGFDETKPYVIVGGHYDSLNGPGANDNATGVAVAMEIARTVDAKPGPLPVMFVGFGAEERQPTPNRDDHHIGSRHYVSKMSPAARANLRVFMNVDMVGHGDVLECDHLATGPREGSDRCLRIAKELGYPVKQRATPDWSDHGSFIREGMNAAWVYSGPYDCCYHNPKDTIAIVREDDVRRASTLSLAIVRSYTR
jgi:aminopeptidase YwaD